MSKRILLIQGHPDASRAHFCHALENAYAEGAASGGHAVKRVHVGKLKFPLLRSEDEWKNSPLPVDLKTVQADILWAEHIVFFFPLWMGDMPALLKAFLEQVARPDFAFDPSGANSFTHKKLAGRSARVVVTMGMPALVYRWYFRAHSVKSLERNILGFVGIGPVSETLVGMVGYVSPPTAEKWLAKLRNLGEQAA